jgi:hypothetical protein
MMKPADASPRDRSASHLDWLTASLLVVSLAINVVLGIRLMVVRGQPAGTQAAPAGPAVGDLLPPIDARRAGAGREVLSFDADGRPTLVYVFAPGRGWCARNANNAKVLFTAARDSYRIVALSLGADVGQSSADFPGHVAVLSAPSPAMRAAYHLGSTPTTLVVSPSGRVLKAWMGAFTGTSKKEVESYFNVTLPGLDRAATAVPTSGGNR